MAPNSTVEMLRGVSLFSECSRKELETISRATKTVVHRAGTVIAREGERGIGLFLIGSGDCSVSIGGKQKSRLHPGDAFGEIALLDGGPRTATVTAITDVSLIGITEWVFRGLLAEHPSVALKTLESVAKRLRSVAKHPV